MISLKEITVDPSYESYVNNAQIISQVLGSCSGYLRGLGCCVKPSSKSSSSSKARSNDDKTEELEEAALKIERLRFKEKELLTRLDQAADLKNRKYSYSSHYSKRKETHLDISHVINHTCAAATTPR
ncbi:hypothetical protein I3842_16G055700 [Carya illinoinensis]|uniref:Uncharacterized protein n=1 Tax=Carya illinoinensis TaxID=32201 RepID=A0A922D5F9_CARIL|nr:hypothetical protein I3842_16G055700 [Carya illinoinensis]